jgi:hypothetical protein
MKALAHISLERLIGVLLCTPPFRDRLSRVDESNLTHAWSENGEFASMFVDFLCMVLSALRVLG